MINTKELRLGNWVYKVDSMVIKLKKKFFRFRKIMYRWKNKEEILVTKH